MRGYNFEGLMDHAKCGGRISLGASMPLPKGQMIINGLVRYQNPELDEEFNLELSTRQYSQLIGEIVRNTQGGLAGQ